MKIPIRSRYRAVAQVHAMGCAVACVAMRTSRSYDRAHELFSNPEFAWTRGYYCPEIVEALSRVGLGYAFAEYEASQHRGLLRHAGTIVFVTPCERYPAGHYLIRTEKGWMNPWCNYPRMLPVKAEIQSTLREAVSYVVFETT